MEKRKYANIEAIEPKLITMREAGKARREIAEHSGLELKQIEWRITRYNRQQAKLTAGVVPRAKGRPRKSTPSRSLEAEQASERRRLWVENKLLQDFPQCAGRR